MAAKRTACRTPRNPWDMRFRTANGLVVADFNGNGIADVGMPCSSGGVLGIGASPGWQISYGGTQVWSTCNTFSSSFSLANGAVGRFSGGPGADILLWYYSNSQGAGTLLDVPGGTGAPYQLSSQDMHQHRFPALQTAGSTALTGPSTLPFLPGSAHALDSPRQCILHLAAPEKSPITFRLP